MDDHFIRDAVNFVLSGNNIFISPFKAFIEGI